MQELEREQRAAVVAEAKSWIGTPFVDCADVKGPNGAVDCAMLLVRVFVDLGIVPQFDPRYEADETGKLVWKPYSAQWFLHQGEEKFLGFISKLGTEVEREPIPGDVLVYQVGRCYAHGAIVVDGGYVVHAYKLAREVVMSPMRDPRLVVQENGSQRPRKIFDCWAKPMQEAA